MALISIKGRKDPIEVPNDIARKVKRRWLGVFETGEGKAEKTDVLDLGDWAGEYGQIKSVELDKFQSKPKSKAVFSEETKSVKFVPVDYQLQAGEKLM